MKYQIGTEFHTYENRNGEMSLEHPMYGIINDINDEVQYQVTWKYIDGDDFDANYTDEALQYTLDNFTNNKTAEYPYIVKTPYNPLPEELFTL